jgi:hypothetical protein
MRLAASKPRRVGQVCKGIEGSLLDGKVQEGRAEASRPVRVPRGATLPLVWGLGGRNAPQSRWVQGERSLLASGVQGGRDSPPDPWSGAGGEGRLQALRVIDRRYGLLARDGLNALIRAMAGGMQRGRAAGPLAKMVL